MDAMQNQMAKLGMETKAEISSRRNSRRAFRQIFSMKKVSVKFLESSQRMQGPKLTV